MRLNHRAIAAGAFVAIVLLGLVPPAPSRASHDTDLANAAPTGWTSTILGSGASGGNDNCPTSLGCDANDATGRRVDDHCGSQQVVAARGTHNYCSTGVAFTRTSGVSSFDVSSFRVKVQMCQTGAGSSCGGASLDMVAMVVTGWSGSTCNGTEYGYYTQTASGTLDTGELEFSGTLPIAITSGTGFCFHAEVTAMNTNQWYTLSSLEIYADPLGPEEVNITEYLYGLRLDHPPFERVIYWEWAVDDCGGSWSIVDQDDDVFGGDFLNCAGEYVGEYVRITIACPVVCGHDVYTITINDTTNNRVATYEIDSDESGELIPDSTAPVITSFTGCYNASTDQCVGIRADLYTAQAAGTLQITYSFTGDPANVTIGQDDVTLGLWYMDGGGDTVDAQVEGWYRVTDTTVNEAASPTFNIYLENFAAEYAWAQVTVNFGAGGHVEIPPPTEEPNEDENGIRNCGSQSFDLGLIACRLGQLIDVLGGVARRVMDDIWGPSVGAVRAAALEKLPFAYIVLAVDGASSQLERLNDEVENSDDCDGITLPVPLYYGMSPTTPTPTTLPITVLTCAQLEPFMGTEWYQAIRTALDPALWLLFGWSQFKALQPKTSLNG